LKKDLYIFSDSYPHGIYEHYIANEIKIIYPYFNKIYFVPINIKGRKRETPDNCEVIDISKYTQFSSLNFIKSLPSIFNIFFIEWTQTKHKFQYFKNFNKLYKKIYNAIIYANALNQISKNNNALFYSYWFYHWALVCAVAKYKGYISNYSSRAHLHDLYEINSKTNCTNFKLSQINNLYCISQHGKDYFISNYPNYINKVKVDYLGTLNEKSNIEKSIHQTFQIVSCSLVRPAKRVDLIYKVICLLPFPVKWIHFGGGEKFDELLEMCKSKPNHIEIELKDQITNKEILEFYTKNVVNLLINLSLEEGLPVSIMEAQSFGIPVLATDVFATKEAVVEGTGQLINPEAILPEIVEAVIELKKHIDDKKINSDFIFEHWNTKFNAKVNYKKFANDLINSNA
jgi:glycosyltransferase involved in cell wall biosynthesis